jgi:hypothetical protein
LWIFIVPFGGLSLAVQALGLRVEFSAAQVNQAARWGGTIIKNFCLPFVK